MQTLPLPEPTETPALRELSEAEHVRLVTPLLVTEVSKLARECGGASSFTQKAGRTPLKQVIGVSDGRVPAPSTLCFVDRAPNSSTTDRLREALVLTTQALAPALEDCSLLIVPDPRAIFIDLLNRLIQNPGFNHFSSLVLAAPALDPSAEIDRTAVVEKGVFVGAHARIAAGCIIKRGTAIGPGVVIRENSVIGAHGIGLYRAADGRLLQFPDLGGVVIGEGVEIGALCSVPSGVLTATFVDRNSVIGNLCNVGHGTRIGQGVWISVGTLIGGNSSIGGGSTLGLGVCVRDNLKIGRNCSIGMGSVVVNDLPDKASVFGNPARVLPRVSAGPER